MIALVLISAITAAPLSAPPAGKLAPTATAPAALSVEATPTVTTGPAADPKTGAQGNRALKFTLDQSRRVYEISVAFSYVTTIWFPVDCKSATVGDPETFNAILDPRSKNKVIVYPQLDQIGARSNVSIECEQGVRVILDLTITPNAQAMQSVEFVMSEGQQQYVTELIDEARAAERAACQRRLDEAAEKQLAAAWDQVLQGMVRRFSMTEDVEYGREKFVVVKAFRQVLIGDTGFILFELSNHSSNDFNLRLVEVVDEATSTPVEVTRFYVPSNRVGPGQSVVGLAGFAISEGQDRYTLLVQEDGTRTIQVTDIDF